MIRGGFSLNRELVTIKRQRFLLFLMIPGLLSLIIFAYVPMYGILLAFKNYSPAKGILGSQWVGLKWILMIFQLPDVGSVVKNTLMYSVLGLVIGFPAPIVLALLFNEVSSRTYKRVVQSISYLPNFLSWVVVSGLVITMMSPNVGLYRFVADILGLPKTFLMQKPVSFVLIAVFSGVWKGVGWGSVIYLAVIAGIDLELYEAAVIDGASRFQRAIYITLPGLVPIVSITLIFAMSGLLASNFEQMFTLMNPMVYGIADVIDTYIYRIGLEQSQFEFSTATGLVRTIIALGLLVIANTVVRKMQPDYTLW